jgi:hypothetical protein
VPGFVLLRCEGDIGEGAIYAVRLDPDERLSHSGFIVPVKGQDRSRSITGLKVYRQPGDRRQFALRSRGGEVPLNGYPCT